MGLARPGEVSLAHHGCLFLDELGLYARHVLESLRSPLEDGTVTIARSAGSVRYPCRFALVAAMNPCPCGYRGDPKKPCTCGELQLIAYRNRLSGPLLDRFDIQIAVERVGREEILGDAEGDTSAEIRARVEAARAIQLQRYESSLLTNASAPRALLLGTLHMTPDARAVLGAAIDTTPLSGRGVDRVMRVARTIADLAGSTGVTDEHIATALLLRVMPFEEVARCV
jgi:magnesium chelatase family protein